MKVKIDTDAAARLFGCEVGDYRDVQRPDALALIEAGDVSAVGDGEALPPAKKKSARKKAGA